MKPIVFLLLFLYLPIFAQEDTEKDDELPFFDTRSWLIGRRQANIFTLEQARDVTLLSPARMLLPEERRLQNIEHTICFFLLFFPEQPQNFTPSWSSSEAGFWQYMRPSRPPRNFREEQRR